MDARLQELLSTEARLPSIPGVAQQVLSLANHPETSPQELSGALSQDPAIASTVLRYVNSPAYAAAYQVDTLERAAVIMGFDAIISVALSFSIVGALKDQTGERLDYPLFWQRSLLSAVAGKAIGATVREPDLEPLFLAALLQDIGMLALDHADIGLYQDLGKHQLNHSLVCQHEEKNLGYDHAYFGAWLLHEWGLPKRISQAVARSHQTPFSRAGEKALPFEASIAISGIVADFFLDKEHHAHNYQRLTDLLYRGFRVDNNGTKRILHKVRDDLNALSAVLKKLTSTPEEASSLEAMAREALARKDVQDTAVQQPVVVRADSYDELKQSSFLADIEDLRGVLSNRVFEAQLNGLVEIDPDCRLNVALIRVNNLQAIEAQYGVKVATLLLRVVGRNLVNSLRHNDLVTRYGDTFGIGLVGTTGDGAKIALERVMEKFSGTRYSIGEGQSVALELSAGIAVAAPSPEVALDEGMTVASKALTEATQTGDLEIVTHLPSAG